MMLTDLIYYDLKLAALIAVFYLFYMLLLARETTHTLNRVVLLTGIVLSVALPLCVVTIHKTLQQTLPLPLPVREGSIYNIAGMVVDEVTTPLPNREGSGVGLLFAAILLAGIILRLLYVAHGYWKLHRLIATGERHTLPSGTWVCVVDAPVAPFSWMQTVVLPRADWERGHLTRNGVGEDAYAPILAHEEAHVRHRHSYDVLVVEMLTALQWFNPVVWFLCQELRTLHEYEADASVLSCGFNESQYIHLLMQKATGIQACALANGINTHKTKKRILMMLKPKSKRATWLKALYIVPVVFVSLAMTAKTVVDYETIPSEDTSALCVFTDQRRGNAYQIRHQPGVRFFRNGVEDQIPEGRSIALEVSKTTLQVNGKPVDQATLPDITTGTLKEIRLTELESDKFVCNMVTEAPDGKTVYIVDGKETTEEEGNKLRKEDIVFVDVIGSRESVKKTLNVEADKAVIIQTKQQADDPVFDVVEQLPSFPGGEAELMGFIAKNIKYPEIATKYGVQGRVIVQFIVEKDGSLSNVKVLENPKRSGASPVVVTAMMPEKERQDAEGHNAGVQAMRDEAIRVINSMPRWSPGKQNGKVVRSKFVLPVTYRLN